jgi:predicted methyltransferase
VAGLEVYEFKHSGTMVALSAVDVERVKGACREGSARLRVAWWRARVDCSGDAPEVVIEAPGGEVRILVSGRAPRSGDRWLGVYSASGYVGKAEFFEGAYYKLAPVGGGPPTLEINRIHMHRIVDGGPWEDAYRKASLVVRRGYRVLDLCTGLGYTASASLARGARLVYTVELDENVLALASINPWSWRLEDPRVTLIKGDALEAAYSMDDEAFDAAIHDPPRFSEETSHLYSLDLYIELRRVLRRGGLLLHYTGEPGKHRRINLPGRVASLLREAGFQVLGFRESVLGVLARKP